MPRDESEQEKAQRDRRAFSMILFKLNQGMIDLFYSETLLSLLRQEGRENCNQSCFT
ncbi:hypothetical protein CLOSTMETH_01910 [[Clostridium] methylpentosum DSM 5476]|uniref:Uncharacterized protein n=1 Tax=[Clostridium] methylpentosum DSM 5476 TaxID=537013 RepID=C0EDI3_9FIRM|nr:hypothetical protein CLOSTMETH_01910 [[Clostridium] methylpentosum DSM 5476]